MENVLDNDLTWQANYYDRTKGFAIQKLKDLETLGLLKIDVLALGMLTAIRKALAMVNLLCGLQNVPHEPGG